jgi:hypothetical protein
MNMTAVLAFIATVPGTTDLTAATLQAHPTPSTTAPNAAVHDPQTIATLDALVRERLAAASRTPDMDVLRRLPA